MPIIPKTRRELDQIKQNRAAAVALTQKRYDERFALDQSKEAGLMNRARMTIAGDADRQQVGFDNARDVSALVRENLLLDRTETRQNTLDDRRSVISEKNIDRGIAEKHFQTNTGISILENMSGGDGLLGSDGDNKTIKDLRSAILRGKSGMALSDIFSTPANNGPDEDVVPQPKIVDRKKIMTPDVVAKKPVVLDTMVQKVVPNRKPYSSSIGTSSRLIDTRGTEGIVAAAKSPYTAFNRVRRDFNRQGGTSQLKSAASLRLRAKKAANL